MRGKGTNNGAEWMECRRREKFKEFPVYTVVMRACLLYSFGSSALALRRGSRKTIEVSTQFCPYAPVFSSFICTSSRAPPSLLFHFLFLQKNVFLASLSLLPPLLTRLRHDSTPLIFPYCSSTFCSALIRNNTYTFHHFSLHLSRKCIEAFYLRGFDFGFVLNVDTMRIFLLSLPLILPPVPSNYNKSAEQKSNSTQNFWS